MPSTNSDVDDFAPTTEAQAIIDFAVAQLATAPEVLDVGDGPGVVSFLVPDGYRRETTDLVDYAAGPRRKTGSDVVIDTESIIAVLQRHANESTVVYVQPERMTAQAVLDDHATAGPGWRQHRTTLRWQPTPSWLRWQAAHRKMLAQDDFAELVEDGLTEISRPAGADLLELAQSIRATTNASFRSDRRLVSGQVQLSYVEEIDARAGADGQMTIPQSITLMLAPFHGSTHREVFARLRYRVNGGKLTLGVIIDRIEEVLLEAIEDEVTKIRTTVPHVPVVYGTVG